MTIYGDLPSFSDVYLEDSWVTNVQATIGRVELTLDVVLRETHPDYRPSLEGEQYCYRNGSIRFEAVSELRWTDQSKEPAVDGEGELDLGTIDSFETHSAGYLLSGDFGSIYIQSLEPPSLTLH